MEEFLHAVAHAVAMAVEAIAIACIAVGALEAVAGSANVVLRRAATDADRRGVWLRFARWLVAALTFQLAADIVNTSLSATWEEVGHLAAVAAIRTFLSYFLDRELENNPAFPSTAGKAREESHGTR